MCFSAPASFIASGGLAIAGVVALKATKKKQKIIAVIPLVFAAQQALEGFQWLSLRAGAPNMVLGYAFLFFALIWWPIYIPLAVYILDRRSHRAIRWFAVLGVAVGGFFALQLVIRPLPIAIFGQCIEYRLDIPFLHWFVLAYVLAVCGAPMLSKRRAFQVFGLVALCSSLVALFFFLETFTSVWCFFMAFLSVLILFYLEYEH